MKVYSLLILLVAAFLISSCTAFLGGPTAYGTDLFNNHSESIFTAEVSINGEPFQTVLDAKRIRTSQYERISFFALAEDPIELHIRVTSGGTERLFSAEYASGAELPWRMRYVYDVALGQFVIRSENKPY